MEKKTYHIQQIAENLGLTIYNPHGLSLHGVIEGLAPLHLAGPSQISFLSNSKLSKQAYSSNAAALILKEALGDLVKVQLLHPQPQVAMARVAQLFYCPVHSFTGQSDLAYTDATAEIDPTATIYPFAFIGPDVRIGKNCVIYPHVYLGEACQVGDDSVLYPGSVLMDHTVIGKNVIIHGNTVLGADGFGFAPGKDQIYKIPQVGHVVVKDDVEIGPLVTIDRATFETTLIHQGAKIDAQVHIGHNCEVGEMTMLCGQVGVAGSVKIGKRCIAAGQVGFAHGVTVGDGIVLGARTGVIASESQAGEYLGMPAIPSQQWRKQMVALKKLPDLLKQVKSLEVKVAELTAGASQKKGSPS